MKRLIGPMLMAAVLLASFAWMSTRHALEITSNKYRVWKTVA